MFTEATGVSLKAFADCTIKSIIREEVTESIGELLTQDPYHRQYRLIGVIAIITRH